MLAPGTDRPRLGVLATLVDMVAGFLPTGPINPTVDLRVSLIDHPPSTGTIYLECHPAKVGRRLFVGETILHTGDIERPFARSTCTFMNQPDGARGGVQCAAGRRHRRGVVRRPAATARAGRRARSRWIPHPWVSNGPAGTIQGGAQALLAEIAAERALLPRKLSTVDLDIRFVNRMRSGPVAATAEIAPGDVDDTFVRVAITDVGDDDRLVSVVTLICRP